MFQNLGRKPPKEGLDRTAKDVEMVHRALMPSSQDLRALPVQEDRAIHFGCRCHFLADCFEPIRRAHRPSPLEKKIILPDACAPNRKFQRIRPAKLGCLGLFRIAFGASPVEHPEAKGHQLNLEGRLMKELLRSTARLVNSKPGLERAFTIIAHL